MIPVEGYAFLDALSVGESGGDYSILYGGSHFHDFSHFPQWEGKDNSHAAGRYQFEPETWREQAEKLGLKDFSPASQDIAAWNLAQTVYDYLTGFALLDDLAETNDNYLADIADALHSTWTSLEEKTFPKRYDDALAKRRGT